MHDVLVPGWSHEGWRRIWQMCAWLVLLVALVIPVVVLLLRGLSDAASAAQLVSLPFAIVSLVIALPTWFRRADSRTDSQVPTTNKNGESLRQVTRGERKPWRVVVTVLVLLIAGAEISTFVLYTAGAFSTEIRAEPVQTPGENPFTPPVGDDQSNVKPPPNVGRTFLGSTVGLYGGTLNISSCDRDKMVSFLQANPDKAAAWASVQGITAKDIPEYIAELTPVILRSDTAVTNHGFANGSATTIHSVLQAGTAVLVDRFGVPRSRCYCGNPLTPSQSFSKPHYANTAWPSFSQANISIVRPVTYVINEFIIVDPVTNAIVYRPAGSQGDRDRGRLEDAKLAGNYALSRQVVTCEGFTEGCSANPMPIAISCSSSNQCTIERLDGGWARPHSLVRNGNSWSASDSDEQAAFCRVGDQRSTRPGTSIRFNLTPISASTIDGSWKVQRIQATYTLSAPAVPGTPCGEARATYELSN
jgi:hypothetical protein